MHPDILREQSPTRGPLSKDDTPEMPRVEALRRLLQRADRYPQCPQCWKALVVQGPSRLGCPNGHVTITMPVRSRWKAIWQRVRALVGGPRSAA